MNTIDEQAASIREISIGDKRVTYGPSEAEIEMWRDLFKVTRNMDFADPEDFDPLTQNERALYDALTKRIHAQICFIGYASTENLSTQEE